MAQPTAVPSAMIAASEDAANQATHDEVSRTGIRLEDSKQLELPEKTKSANGGATSLGNKAAPHPRATEQKHAVSHENAPRAQTTPTESENAASEEEAPSESIENPQQKEALAELKALNEKASGHKSEKPHHATSTKSLGASGKFTLQIGSYSSEKDAEERLKDLEISGLSPRIHATDLKSKGRWYRIYLGGFPTKAAAEKAGKKYRAQGVIDSFIVAKSVE
jgi:cell division protein FtsN